MVAAKKPAAKKPAPAKKPVLGDSKKVKDAAATAVKTAKATQNR